MILIRHIFVRNEKIWGPILEFSRFVVPERSLRADMAAV